MKEIEKLADEFARSDKRPWCCDCLEDTKASFEAGFRKAREIALRGALCIGDKHSGDSRTVELVCIMLEAIGERDVE